MLALSPALTPLDGNLSARIESRSLRLTVWWLALWLAVPGNLPLWQRLLSLPDSAGNPIACGSFRDRP